MNRRTLLATTLLAPLGACAALGTATPAQVIADIQTIAGGISAVLPTVLAVVGVGSSVATQISNYVADVQAAAAAIGKATTTAAASPLASPMEAACACRRSRSPLSWGVTDSTRRR